MIDYLNQGHVWYWDDISPGPDGFTSAFFKKGWDVVGQDICKAVRDFFVSGKLLKEVNHTLLALILKVTTPLKVNDYRPISCCNDIYKCISKTLTNRIIEGIKEVVSDNQSLFVLGRRISDNILITQELMHNYHCDRGPPRCAFKVDIQNAYDTVDWCFLERILACFGFHPNMIKWIMTCVTSTSFSISINGDIHVFFKGERGSCQGDPLSPYLFTLVMEILMLILQKWVRLSDSFRFHKNREDLNIINVCFADDLFLFARGDVNSAKVIMDSLDEFKAVSGFVPSIPKSTTYFCNVLNHVKIGILNTMPFSKGRLPAMYLGVLLISSRLINKDFKILVEKARNWIGDWKNKSLSYAGRLQLCSSAISSMQLYWASIFILPKGIIYDIQQLIRAFLWCNGEIKRGKAKVAWEEICLPKSEGGLALNLNANQDYFRWCDANGNMNVFSVKLVWEALRPHDGEVVWHKTVWFSYCIPRYAFHLWLVMRRSLKTQDKLRPWDVAPSTDRCTLTCVSCNTQMDSCEHLFFECDYAAKVWTLVRGYAEMDAVQPILNDILFGFQPLGSRRTFQVIVGKLIFAASSYHVWRERNNRLFKETEKVGDKDKPLRSCLAARIKNIDGKMMGEDRKPLRSAIRNVRFVNHKEANSLHENVHVTTPLANDISKWDSSIAVGIYQDKTDTQENPNSKKNPNSKENPNCAPMNQGSFDDALNSNKPSSKSKFRSFFISEQVENANVVLSLATFTAAQQRMRFARALIMVSAKKELKQEVIMVVLEVEGTGHTHVKIQVKYEWKPPLCNECHVFRHNLKQCPKHVVEPVKPQANQERKIKGLKLNKPKATFMYRPKVFEPASTIEATGDDIDLLKLKNQFDSLRDQDDLIKENKVGETSGANANDNDTNQDEDLESDVEEIYLLCPRCALKCLDHGIGRPMPTFVLKVAYHSMWNLDIVNVMVVSQTSQVMHVKIIYKVSGIELFCSFVYADNLSVARRPLWADLEFHKNVIRGGSGLLKKLDRIMGNTEFIDAFNGAYALFQPYRILNHSPVSQFRELLSNAWNVNIDGHMMYQVVSKLKALKKGNLHERVNKLRVELDAVQNALDLNPNDLFLREEAKLDEERFLKQKAKLEWLEKVSADSSSNMIRLVTDEEIKMAMFSIGDERAPGPDGCLLLKEINHTFIALISKVSTRLKVNDYHPTTCCNVIYKCISKILTNHIIDGTKEVVSNNKSAFVPTRRISNNILITQELMHNYHRNRGPPRFAFKIDIQKVYGIVDWRFLGCVLKYFGFHPCMVKWIMACVTSTSFSLNINVDIHGFFKGKRGLRQGDPLFPYLFTLVMEIVILNIMPFAEGELPVKYLGVPLISSRLLNKDCKVLVEKAKNRIEDWKNKSLSFVDRPQLCKLILFYACLLGIGSHHPYRWPHAWIAKAPILNLIPAPYLDENSVDCIRWRDFNGLFSEFSVSRAWEAFRPRGNEVWKLVRHLADMELLPPILHDIIDHL
uniref:Reverse transcriptase domain-containing protein n=1 Tax=Tanacetum cinerariifolium TaxID=118510 RepID=A0A6L2M9T5_TANCI|nr:hypothetical protein [Tanacetum cinerariifolium]